MRLSPGRGAGRDPASSARGSHPAARTGALGPRSLGHSCAREDGRAANPVKRNRPEPNFLLCRVSALSLQRPGLPVPPPPPPLGRARARRAPAVPGAGCGPQRGGGFSPRGADRDTPPPPNRLPTVMASPGRSEEQTCHLLLPFVPTSQQGSARIPFASLLGLCWGSRDPRPEPRPWPCSRRDLPATLPLRPLPVSLSLSAARPRPVRAARWPIVSAPARATLWGAGGRPPALPFTRSEPVLPGRRGVGGTPVPWVPRCPRSVPFSAPTSLLGARGQGKFVPKFPLIYSKVWQRRRVIFFFFFRLHPVRLQVSSHSFPLTGFDCLTASVFVSSLFEQLLIYSVPWL